MARRQGGGETCEICILSLLNTFFNHILVANATSSCCVVHSACLDQTYIILAFWYTRNTFTLRLPFSIDRCSCSGFCVVHMLNKSNLSNQSVYLCLTSTRCIELFAFRWKSFIVNAAVVCLHVFIMFNPSVALPCGGTRRSAHTATS